MLPYLRGAGLASAGLRSVVIGRSFASSAVCALVSIRLGVTFAQAPVIADYRVQSHAETNAEPDQRFAIIELSGTQYKVTTVCGPYGCDFYIN